MDKKSRELVMAKLYLKNKDYKMAEQSFNEYLALNPEDVSALKSLGQVYEQINKFDKAFEMYERCYLAEPERTGVLLDICRILLTKGNSLDQENIDRRKWLNLAIRAFPSNPIVVNYKALLATLPPDEQTPTIVTTNKNAPTKQMNNIGLSGRSEDTLLKVLDKLERLELLEKQSPNIPNNNYATNLSTNNSSFTSNRNEETLLKVLDRLSQIDKRLDKIENIIVKSNAVAKVSQLTPSATKSATPEAPKVDIPQFSKVTPETAKVFTPETTKVFTPESAKVFTPETPKVTTPLEAPKPASTNLFSESLKKFDIPFTFGKLTTSEAPTTPATTSGSVFTTPLFSSITNTSSTFTSTAFSGHTFGSPAFSAPAFNIPSLGAPGFSNPTSTVFGKSAFSPPTTTSNNDGGDDEVVQNEELPIEHTCDMTPIEYKTGEEDEDVLFKHRAKLFRFKDKEFKERGLGDIKVLKHRETSKARLIMRRDGIGIVCLNCWDCKNVTQVRDNQIKFCAVDASDGLGEATVFLVKFKLKETAEEFMKYLNDLFQEGVNSVSSTPAKPSQKKNPQNEAEVELVDPILDQNLVNKARELQLPDLFYHKIINQEPCQGCDGCEKDSN